MKSRKQTTYKKGEKLVFGDFVELTSGEIVSFNGYAFEYWTGTNVAGDDVWFLDSEIKDIIGQ